MAKTFYLIDGHSQIFRAYYAPFSPLTSASGEPTKATLIFTQMVLAILREQKPDYLAMAMDVSDSSTQRAAIYSEYKTNRERTPEDLPVQVDRIVEIVELLGIPIFRVQGYEADDLIATIAAKIEEPGAPESQAVPTDLELRIVSRDKDLYQLLTSRVKLWDPMKDDVIDPEALERTSGFTPAQAVEIQTLTGDAIDNIPGIPGVGPKTAVSLIKKYGSAAAVIAHADELTPKLRENVRAFGDRIALSRALVTLDRAVPFAFDLEACRVKPVPTARLRPLFEKLSFRRLLEQLDLLAGESATSARPAAATAPTPVSQESTVPSGEPRGENTVPAGGARGENTVPAGGARGEATGPQQGTLPIFASAGVAALPGAQGDYRLVDTEPALEELIDRLAHAPLFALEVATTSPHTAEAEVVGLSFSWQAGEGRYVPLRSRAGRALDRDQAIARLKPLLEDPARKKCGHHLKYDLHVLRHEGIQVAGAAFDSMIASYLLEPEERAHSLESLASEVLKLRKLPITDLIGKGKSTTSLLDVDPARLATYAGETADLAFRLHAALAPRIEASPLRALLHDVEMPLVRVLADMEYEGIRIDGDLLRGISAAMGRRIEELRVEIYAAAGREFLIDSPKQLGEVLFDEHKLRSVRKTKTSRSTDADVLETLAIETAHPLPRLVLEYRELAKLRSTYVDPLPELLSPRTGRLHATFQQTVAATGRLSSSDPNIQNIPIRTEQGREIRRAFVARDRHHVLLTADYSQIELRILAHLSRDETLLEAFREDRDIHAFVAAQIAGVPITEVTREARSKAKAVNFGIIYGQGPFGLARSLGIPQRDAARFIAAYKARYPGITRFLKDCVTLAEETGKVSTLLGRQRAIPEIHSLNRARRALGERLAINTVVQGSAADMIKVAMVRIHERLRREGNPARLLIQVHDELVLEAPRDAAARTAEVVREEMTRALPLSVPIKADVGWGENWLEAKA